MGGLGEGNRMYTVKLKTEKDAEEFIRFVQERC